MKYTLHLLNRDALLLSCKQHPPANLKLLTLAGTLSFKDPCIPKFSESKPGPV